MGRENLNNASSGPSPYVYGSATVGQGANAGDSHPPPRSEVGRQEPGGRAPDWRAGEAVMPKFAKDVSRAVRYSAEGVRTTGGDSVQEDVSPYQVLVQALGFTPAQIAERYESNRRMRNKEQRNMDERRSIQRDAGDAALDGKPIPPEVTERILDFNRRYPDYPITGDTLRRSIQGRQRASQRNEAGTALNPRLDRRIRDEEPRMIYN